MTKKTLNRMDAFSSILSNATTSVEEQGVDLNDIQLNPSQPRRFFSRESLEKLTASIRDKGVLQPILLRKLDTGYELVAGERRYRAAKAAGLTSIPAIIKDLTDEEALELALVENLNREDLNPLEETEAMLRLLSLQLDKPRADVIIIIQSIYDVERGRSGNTGVSMEEASCVTTLFARIGRLSVSSFNTHRLPLLKLPDALLNAVRDGSLEYSKARLLSTISDGVVQAELLKETLEKSLSRQELQARIKQRKMPQQQSEGASEGVFGAMKHAKGKLSRGSIKKLPLAKQQELKQLLEQISALFS